MPIVNSRALVRDYDKAKLMKLWEQQGSLTELEEVCSIALSVLESG